MGTLGVAQTCERLIAFRVDQRTIPSGNRLRKYYMHQYACMIGQMQSLIEAGFASLVQYLNTSEWQQISFSDKTVSLESDSLKMMVILEAIFEHAREKFAPHLPSRLNCVFVWPTLELAKKFREQYLPEGVIHRCCVMRGEAVEMDGGLLPPGINLSNLSPEIFYAEFQAARLRAEKYWVAQELPNQAELLVVGDVEVVRVETEQ